MLTGINSKYIVIKRNNLNKRLKREYYQDEFSRCGNDVNKNWKILKHLLPNKNKETDTKLVINNELIL